jgi:tripartite-type tricarboxylate transporter receptor subunit TctC
MRLYGDVVSRNIGYRVVIENRAGGGGVIAAMSVKAARPDGYTLRLADIGADAILPAMQKLPYDTPRDFRPITMLLSWPQFVIVPKSSPANSIADLIALARKKPGGLSHGSQGVGSGGHLLGAMFQIATGAPMVHVPYKGGGPLFLDLLTGRVDVAFTSYREARAALADKKVKVLAIAGPHRSPLVPSAPTMAEVGYPTVELSPWFGLAAPAGTPDAVIQKLHEEFVKGAKDPELIRKLGEDAIELNTGTPADFAALISSERERLGKVIRAVGLRAE